MSYIDRNLMKLNKEQLVKIIRDYDNMFTVISEICVDESKWHIESKDAVRKIRELLQKIMYSLYDENLATFVDLQLRKISGEEYRDITLGV